MSSADLKLGTDSDPPLSDLLQEELAQSQQEYAQALLSVKAIRLELNEATTSAQQAKLTKELKKHSEMCQNLFSTLKSLSDQLSFFSPAQPPSSSQPLRSFSSPSRSQPRFPTDAPTWTPKSSVGIDDFMDSLKL